jgi:hypothetical protein
MTTRGVETAPDQDEFAGLFHAQHHFAPGFVVIAGGGEDRFDGLGAGTDMQEVEDGLALGGVDGTSREARQLSGVAFAQPVQGEDALVVDGEVVGKDRWRWAEGVFGGEQEIFLFIGGVGGQEETAAGSGQDGRSGTVGTQRVGRGLRQGAGEHEGAARALGQHVEQGQAATQAGNGGTRIDED